MALWDGTPLPVPATLELPKVDVEQIDKLFPFKDANGNPTYNPGQRESIIKTIAAFNRGVNTVILDAPTGSGKSAIAHTVMMVYGGKAWGATPLNTLVDQYGESGWETIKGAGNFDCTKHKGSCRIGSSYERSVSGLSGTGCNKDCPYKIARNQFLRAKNGGMTNTNFLWSNLKAFTDEDHKREVLVLDEAHLLEADLADMMSVRITADDLATVEYNEPLVNYDQIQEWLEGYSMALNAKIATLKSEMEAMSKSDSMKSSGEFRQKQKLNDTLFTQYQALEQYEHYQSSARWIPKWETNAMMMVNLFQMEPVYGGFLAKKLFQAGNKRLLMSATFLDKEHTCIELDMDPADTEYIQIDSWFPDENQPFYIDPEIRLNYRNQQDMAPFLAGKIDRIIDHHLAKGETHGIIHTVSYKLTKLIMDHTKHRSILSYVSDGEKQADAVRKHTKAKKSVLIGPAFTEGLDLKDDLGRFSIIAKVPFAPVMVDEKLKIRVADHPQYGDLLTVRKLVQQKGRVIRGGTDYGANYCLDGHIMRLLNGPARRFFPKQFLDTIHIFQGI